MKLERKIILILVLVFLVGIWLGSELVPARPLRNQVIMIQDDLEKQTNLIKELMVIVEELGEDILKETQ